MRKLKCNSVILFGKLLTIFTLAHKLRLAFRVIDLEDTYKGDQEFERGLIGITFKLMGT